MSILPTFLSSSAIQSAATASQLKMPKEYGVDFSTGQLTGQIVEGKEALKVWIWNCLKTQRFRFPIYSWDYGADLEQYIGQTVTEEFLNTDCENEIKEAMLVNPFITGITNFSASFAGSRLKISYTAETRFGDVEVSYDV